MAAPHSLAPGFLIASPKLDGSPFERALILMVHHDQHGAMGFIVNKALELDFATLLESLDEEVDDVTYAPGEHPSAVHFGGPVRLNRLWLIYRVGHHALPGEPQIVDDLEELERSGALRFHDDWVLVANWDVISRFVCGDADNRYRPFIGYTGWGAGQLEDEIEQGSWLLVDFEDEMVLDALGDESWDAALARLGVAPTAFLMMGKAGSA